jgi:hypothetical protein
LGLDLLSFADRIVPDGEGDEAGEEMEEEDLEMDDEDLEDLASDLDEVRYFLKSLSRVSNKTFQEFAGFGDEEDDQLEDFNTTDEEPEDDIDNLTKANTARNSASRAPQEPKDAIPIEPIPTPSTAVSTPAAASTSKYIPPHLRNLIPKTDEPKVEKTVEQIKLERKLQGLLNK